MSGRREAVGQAVLAQSYRCTEARAPNRTIDDAWSHFMELEINAGDVMRRGSLGPTTADAGLRAAGRVHDGQFRQRPGHSDNEGPQHKVTISKPFYMGVYTVTTEQRDAGHGKQAHRDGGRPALSADRGHLDDACEFCRKLSRQTGRNFHLPTEAQREYACRAGSKTAYFYGEDPTGSRLSEFAWTHGPRVSGKLKPNDWGLHDMLSNVPEWCSDYYADSYDTKDAADPSGPASGTKRAVRGAMQHPYEPPPTSPPSVPIADCRCAHRQGLDPQDTLSRVGFRVVMEPDGAGNLPPATRPSGGETSSKPAETAPSWRLAAGTWVATYTAPFVRRIVWNIHEDQTATVTIWTHANAGQKRTWSSVEVITDKCVVGSDRLSVKSCGACRFPCLTRRSPSR